MLKEPGPWACLFILKRKWLPTFKTGHFTSKSRFLASLKKKSWRIPFPLGFNFCHPPPQMVMSSAPHQRSHSLWTYTQSYQLSGPCQHLRRTVSHQIILLLADHVCDEGHRGKTEEGS